MQDLALLLAAGCAAIGLAGVVQATVGWLAVRRHCRTVPSSAPASRPITVLKPLHGDEPLLEEALASFCMQDYQMFQIVFGLQDPADPALNVVRRLRARFPQVNIDVVVDTAQHGVNRKVSNLINMLPRAEHDVLVIADSDIHAPRTYLREIAGALSRPGVGLVTTLYAGLGASKTLAAWLGTAQINHIFLPGALLARTLGRQDCLGATMALTRQTLEQVGGFGAIVHHLADDAVLGRLVRNRGKRVALATTVPATTVPEMTLTDLFAHELRWGRTIQSLAPIGFPLSTVQYPLFWGGAAMLLSCGAGWSLELFGAIWLVRIAATAGINGALGLAAALPGWLLPLRDLMSVAVIVASYCGNQVAWRGHVLHISPPSLVPGKG